jgi:hypothetical protein
MTTASRLHRPGQPLFGVWRDDEMVVGCHEGECVNADIIVSSRFCDYSTKVLTITFTAGNRFSIDPTREHVNADTGYENAWRIGHASRRARIVLARFLKEPADGIAHGAISAAARARSIAETPIRLNSDPSLRQNL